MTEEEKKDIEEKTKYLMSSLAMKYEDIPYYIIFRLISSTVLDYAVEVLQNSEKKKKLENGKTEVLLNGQRVLVATDELWAFDARMDEAGK